MINKQKIYYIPNIIKSEPFYHPKKVNCRLGLKMHSLFDSSNKIFLVLMMNPSHADDLFSDETTNNLISILNYNLEIFKTLITVNISPIIEPSSKKVTKIDNTIIDDNKDYIENILLKNKITDVVVATGNIIKNVTGHEAKESFIKSYNEIMEILYGTKNINIHRIGAKNVGNSNLDEKDRPFGLHPNYADYDTHLQKVHIEKNDKDDRIKYRLEKIK